MIKMIVMLFNIQDSASVHNTQAVAVCVIIKIAASKYEGLRQMIRFSMVKSGKFFVIERTLLKPALDYSQSAYRIISSI